MRHDFEGSQYYVRAAQLTCVPTNKIFREAYWAALSAQLAAARAAEPRQDVSLDPRCRLEEDKQILLLHDIFSNPFHPVSLNPSWRTRTARALAQSIYEERRFDDLPILADTLEDAGCDSEEILLHLRGPGPHVLGCWALDLILQKT